MNRKEIDDDLEKYDNWEKHDDFTIVPILEDNDKLYPKINWEQVDKVKAYQLQKCCVEVLKREKNHEENRVWLEESINLRCEVCGNGFENQVVFYRPPVDKEGNLSVPFIFRSGE
jgi:hypothetical protein